MVMQGYLKILVVHVHERSPKVSFNAQSWLPGPANRAKIWTCVFVLLRCLRLFRLNRAEDAAFSFVRWLRLAYIYMRSSASYDPRCMSSAHLIYHSSRDSGFRAGIIGHDQSFLAD